MGREQGIRICGTKVKTGCSTCKSRRIKCDEAKPFCRKCTSTRRHCGGYLHLDERNRQLPMVIYRAPSTSFALTELERQSLAFFIARTKYRFPKQFSQPVLQAASNNRPLAYSIISLGALQQLFEYGDYPYLKTDLGILAAQQYGKALQALRSHQEPPSADTLMICSILFTCFECLRGFRRAAVIHIKAGLNLFRQSKAQATWNIVSENTIGFLFTRLENQLIELLGVAVREKNSAPPPLTSSTGYFTSKLNGNCLHDSLDTLVNHILHEKLNLAVTKHSQVPWIAPGRSSHISSFLEEWRLGFLAFDSQPPSSEKESNHAQVSDDCEEYGQDPTILTIWYLLSKIYIAIQPSVDNEDAWDQFLGDFDTMVTLSESYLSRSRHYGRKRTFTYSLGVIPPLFIASTRCRNSSIRQRALQQLVECNRIELIWDSRLVAEAARRVINIEEPLYQLNTIDLEGNKKFESRVRTLTVCFDNENGAELQIETVFV